MTTPTTTVRCSMPCRCGRVVTWTGVYTTSGGTLWTVENHDCEKETK